MDTHSISAFLPLYCIYRSGTGPNCGPCRAHGLSISVTEDVYAKVQEEKHSQAVSISRVSASLWKSAETNIVVRKAPIAQAVGTYSALAI